VPAGLVWPSPVAKSETYAPALTGLAALFSVPSITFIAAACPAPVPLTVKRLGAELASETEIG